MASSRSKSFGKKNTLTLVIIFVFVGIILFFIFVYSHEIGHRNALRSHGIQSKIKLTLSWPFGETYPISLYDCEKFNGLTVASKAEILYAGIKYNAINLGTLCFLNLVATGLLINNPKLPKTRWYTLLVLILILAILELSYLIYVNSNPLKVGSDMWSLINDHQLDC